MRNAGEKVRVPYAIISTVNSSFLIQRISMLNEFFFVYLPCIPL